MLVSHCCWPAWHSWQAMSPRAGRRRSIPSWRCAANSAGFPETSQPKDFCFKVFLIVATTLRLPKTRPIILYDGLCGLCNRFNQFVLKRDRKDLFRFAPLQSSFASGVLIRPLPDTTADLTTLKRWFRQFIEVRDAEGAERCVVSAVRAGADHRQMADMLFAAATDHRYIQIGHVLDFTNKALEALDLGGWELAEPVLTSLALNYAKADRMEESNAWRHPVDLVAILERAFDVLPAALEAGRGRRGTWAARDALVPVVF